ncbi:MAG: threonine ammonia-lyase [Candidatus Gastranaerophilaceae bacterium]
MVTIDRIKDAARILNGNIRETDLIFSPAINPKSKIFLKCENLQVTGSFKIRGAFYKISQLSQSEREKGVIACSAGNHAQGVALSAQKNGIKATIFIPSIAPLSKIEATKKYGAEVRLIDGVYDDAYEAAVKYYKESGAVFVHPFDDELVIAGQGTIGLELLRQLPELDAVIVPIGGGGLIGGVAACIKNINPRCKVYGVQAKGAPSMVNALELHELHTLDKVSTVADGIAVKTPGSLTFELCEKYVDDIVTVEEDEIATAILTLIEQQKLIAEGAGAVSVAAAMFNKLPIENKNTACVVSGGNIDVTILSRVINRGLLTSGRLSDLTIELLDKPGQLKDVATIIADLGANVVKVRHNPGGKNTDINGCYLKVSMETRNHEHLSEIKKALENKGYKIIKG